MSEKIEVKLTHANNAELVSRNLSYQSRLDIIRDAIALYAVFRDYSDRLVAETKILTKTYLYPVIPMTLNFTDESGEAFRVFVAREGVSESELINRALFMYFQCEDKIDQANRSLSLPLTDGGELVVSFPDDEGNRLIH